MRDLEPSELKWLNGFINAWRAAIVILPLIPIFFYVETLLTHRNRVFSELPDSYLSCMQPTKGLSYCDAGSLLLSAVAFFGPVVFALLFIMHKIKSDLNTQDIGPHQQRRLLKHLRVITGVQALIGLAFATIIIQWDPGPAEMGFFIITTFWSGTALLYFVGYYYHLKVEEPLKTIEAPTPQVVEDQKLKSQNRDHWLFK